MLDTGKKGKNILVKTRYSREISVVKVLQQGGRAPEAKQSVSFRLDTSLCTATL